MGEQLSAQDVERLLADTSEENRAMVAAKVADHLDAPALSPRERDLALEIIARMVNDAAVRVRQALSTALKDNTDIPREVALKLASDADIVAAPMLRHSLLLHDEDLIALLRGGGAAKQVAIAERPQVSAAVSDAIIDCGGADAVAALVANAAAEITETGFARVVDRFGDDETVQVPLVRRDLPAAVAERLLNFTSQTLTAFFATAQYVQPDLALAIIRKHREDDTVRLRPAKGWAVEAEPLARQLHAGGRLTSSLLLRALCAGNAFLFEAGLAVLAGIPVNNAYRLIQDHPGGRGFEQLYRAAGLPERLFPAFTAALTVTRQTTWNFEEDPEGIDYSQTVIWRILTQFEGFDADDLDYLLFRHDLPP